MSRYYHIDIDESPDFVDEMMRAIEKDYGRSIARIPLFEAAVEPHSFKLKVIFTDFKLFEADIKIVPLCGIPTVQIYGTYL